MPQSASTLHLLICSHSIAFHEAFCRRLERFGLLFDADFLPPSAATDSSNEEDWDVILVDTDAGDDDPWKEVGKLRHLHPGCPLIALTSMTSEASLEEGIDAGATEIVGLGAFETLPVLIERLGRMFIHHREQQSSKAAEIRSSNRLQESLRILAQNQEQLLEMERARITGEMTEQIVTGLTPSLESIRKEIGQIGSSTPPRGTLMDAINQAWEVLDQFAANTKADEELQSAGTVDLAPILVELPFILPEDGSLESLPLVNGTPERLQRALNHLVAHAQEVPGETGKLPLEVECSDREVCLAIQSTEEGLKSPADPTRVFGGLERGLAESILHDLGGALTVHGNALGGATATVHLQRATFASCSATEAKPRSESETGQAPGQQILLVDDDPQLSGIVARYLELEGHQVKVTHSAMEGLAAFRAQAYDVVLSDRCMVGMNGDELAVAIHQLAPETPFILLSGFGDAMQVRGECPSEVDLILPKPINRSSLQEAILQVTSDSQTQRQAA